MSAQVSKFNENLSRITENEMQVRRIKVNPKIKVLDSSFNSMDLASPQTTYD
jgi:hypothetical protein